MVRRELRPFNIRLLDLNPQRLRGVGQVTSLEYFDTTTKDFHPEGLFSTEIFGRVGDAKRRSHFGYIDIKVPVLHPILYRACIRLRALLGGIMQGKVYAVWDPAINNFVASDAVTGRTGYAFFMEHWEDLTFERTQSAERNDRITLIEKYRQIGLITKVPVIPAGLRDMEITEDGRPSSDEVNDIYRALLGRANTVMGTVNPEVIDIYDNTRWSLQTSLNKLYEYFETMISGKNKFILGKYVSRRIQNSTRNVISAHIPKNKRLGAPGNVRMMDNIVGIHQAMALIRPVFLYRVKRMFIDYAFSSMDAPARLINRKTLEQQELTPSVDTYDSWLTNEGLVKQFAIIENPAIRHRPVVIADHYLALVYNGVVNGKLVYKVFFDIRDLPKGFNRKDVHPITWAELVYLTIHEVCNQYPSFNVRYPIDYVGSIQPGFLHLKSTVPGEERYQLDESWELDPTLTPAYSYPVIGNAFHDTSSPHLFRLAAQGGDPGLNLSSFI